MDEISEEGKFESLNVELNETSKFKKNKCPIDLKKNKEYFKLDRAIGSQKEGFECCTKNPVHDEIHPLYILVGLFYCFTFYMLIIAYLVDDQKSTILIVFIILVYICGSFVQTVTLPKPCIYKTKSDLDKDMEKILNLGVKIKYKNTSKKRKIETVYPGCYTTDITGTLIIPKTINFIKIKGLIVYADKDYSNYKKDFRNTYKNTGTIYLKHSLSLYSDGNEFEFPKEQIYILNSLLGPFSINCINRLAYILMFEWLIAIYEIYSDKKSSIHMMFVKLISTERKIIPPTKITVHGTTYSSNESTYIDLSAEEDENFKNDLEAYKQKMAEEAQKKREEQERKRQREKEKADNTEELSYFDSNNYDMRVYKYYNSVYLDLKCHEDKRNSYKNKKIYLGEYDGNVEENEEDEDDQVIYTPKGCDIQIVVKNYAYNYTIKIGTKFTKSFSYYDN